MRNEIGASTGTAAGLRWMKTLPGQRSLAAVRNGLTKALSQVGRLSKGVLSAQSSRRLKVVETVSLGEKRFVSVLQIDGEEFLLGGSASSVVVLAKLERAIEAREPFGRVLAREGQNAERISNSSREQASEGAR